LLVLEGGPEELLAGQEMMTILLMMIPGADLVPHLQARPRRIKIVHNLVLLEMLKIRAGNAGEAMDIIKVVTKIKMPRPVNMKTDLRETKVEPMEGKRGRMREVMVEKTSPRHHPSPQKVVILQMRIITHFLAMEAAQYRQSMLQQCHFRKPAIYFFRLLHW
jgi:hypothetical protein